MNYKLFTLMGALLAGCACVMAQDYEDDIYYDGSKETKTVKVVTKQVPPSSGYYGELTTQVTPLTGVVNGRDVDEYNRRYNNYDESDTVYLTEEEFANTRRIEKFHNPTIVIRSNDPGLMEYYFDSTPTVNLIVGTDWSWGPYWGWGYRYYDPWYSWSWGWNDPWYYSGWYGWGWPGGGYVYNGGHTGTGNHWGNGTRGFSREGYVPVHGGRSANGDFWGYRGGNSSSTPSGQHRGNGTRAWSNTSDSRFGGARTRSESTNNFPSSSMSRGSFGGGSGSFGGGSFGGASRGGGSFGGSRGGGSFGGRR